MGDTIREMAVRHLGYTRDQKQRYAYQTKEEPSFAPRFRCTRRSQ